MNRVGTCGEYFEFDVAVGYFKVHLAAFGTAYPIALHIFERIGPIDGLQALQEPFCIRRNAEEPLFHRFLYDGVAAALRYAVFHFVVGEYST